MKKLGHILFASCMAGLGILSLLSGDFALDWQPVPDGIPFRRFLAYMSGAILVATGLGSLVPRTARASMRALTIFVLLWAVVLRLPRVIAHPLDEGKWLGLGETLVLVVGGWMTLLWIKERGRDAGSPDAEKQLRMARFIYGVSLPAIGLSHLMYGDGTASLVPAWLPCRLAFAYLTGAGHIAAGLGILLGILPRLAATLEAIMISLFTLLIWVPRAANAPASRFEWTALFVSSALTAAAWTVAGSFDGFPWGWVRRRAERPAAQETG
jgi:uncharacterized membrane protein